MKTVLAALSAQYIHTCLAARSLCESARRAGFAVTICERTVNEPFGDLLAALALERPDVIGFPCYLWNIALVRELCVELRKLLPHVRLCLGGPEVSFCAEKVLRELPEADFVLSGEGEESFPTLLGALADGRSPGNVPGLWFREAGVVRAAAPAAPVPMASLPFPYPELLSGDTAPLDGKILYFETSRGCPFSCTYCLSSREGGVRLMPAPLACERLSVFLRARVRQVKFVDRSFNANRAHCDAILAYLLKHDNGVTNFHFEIEAELLADSTLALIRQARPGLFQFEAGVQSTNRETLRAVRRSENVMRVLERCAALLGAGGCHLHMDLIAGLPFEDYASLGRSFDDVFRTGPHMLQLGFLKLLRGTQLEEDAAQFGIVCSTRPPYEVLFTPWISYEELCRLKKIDSLCGTLYNSGRFSTSLPFLLRAFDSPFAFFETLASFAEARGAFGRPWGRYDGHALLLAFCEARGGEAAHLRWLLRFDALREGRARGLPDFLTPPQPPEAAGLLRAAARDEAALLSRFPRLAAVPPRERPAEIRRTFRFAWFPFSPLTGEAGVCIAAIDTAAPASASYAVRPAGEAEAVLPVPGP